MFGQNYEVNAYALERGMAAETTANAPGSQGPSTEPACYKCGMLKANWKGNEGRGYTKDGLTYCCQGCAEGTGCTCR
jgi:hypothetical protein